MNLRGFLLVALFAAVAVIGLAAFLVVSPGRVDVAEATSNQTIYAKALTSHGCDSSEWHFVINQVRLGEMYAPDNIRVVFDHGGAFLVPLDKFTGKVAHYVTTDGLDSTVARATARIYGDWSTGGRHGSGQFNLSHGPCGESTPTPTPTPTVTPTPTPTPCPECEPTPTPDPTPTVTPVTTSTFVAPAGFPDTGGEPACDNGYSRIHRMLYVLGGLGAGMIAGASLAQWRRR